MARYVLPRREGRDFSRRFVGLLVSLARTRVVVADDHPVYREGIAAAIRERPELDLVGEASNGREALVLIRSMRPDVALLDVRLPSLDGTAVMSEVKRGLPGTRVLLLSAVTTGNVVYDAIQKGADGFIAKTASRREICEALTSVARGNTFLSPELTSGIADEIRGRISEPAVLTPREHEILVLVAEGLGVQEIGERLSVSSSTVKTHLQRTYQRLGVSERAAAVAEAMRRGLLA